MGVGPLEVFIMLVCKIGLQKKLQIFCNELGFVLGVMRGFQKGITAGGRTPGSVHNVGLQNRVAKKFANFLYLRWDLSRGS